MKVFLLPLIFCLPIFLQAQCLDSFTKILPDLTVEKPLRYSNIASGGDYFVVSSQEFDTTGYFNAGAAFVYQRISGAWKYVATLTPSDTKQEMQFGEGVAMDSLGQTIAIYSNDQNSNQGTLYVFRMSPGGWVNMTETERISTTDTQSAFTSMAISKDGLTLAIGQGGSFTGLGEVWIYERGSISINFASSTPFKINAPTSTEGFASSIAITNQNIVVGTEYYNFGAGYIYVFDKNSVTNYPLRATLKVDSRAAPFGSFVQARNNLIVSPGILISSDNTTYSSVLYSFEKKPGQSWTDTIKGITVPYSQPLQYPIESARVAILNDSTLGVAYSYSLQKPGFVISDFGIIEQIIKTGKGWNQSVQTVLLEEDLPNQLFPYALYGASVSWNGEQFLTTPTLNEKGSIRPNAITSITFKSSSWDTPIKIKGPGINSNDFHFGNTLVMTHNDLLIGAPYDSEIGMRAGAVGIYQKGALNEWIKIGKILPPSDRSMDDVDYATTIVADDSVLAVNAINYRYLATNLTTVSGKVFIYKRTGQDWTSNIQSQVITAPGTFYNFGGGLAINSSLLVVSGQDFGDNGNSGNRNALAIYKRSKGNYEYFQTIEFNNPAFEPYASQSKIIIRNDTIFSFSGNGSIGPAGSYILAKNTSGIWQVISNFALPSTFSNAGLFTFEVDQDHVFLGVPTADVGSVQEAGSVLVYSKLPGTKWPVGDIESSGIILPNNPIKGQYFGYSLSVKENILMIGATGDNLYTNNTNVVTPFIPGSVFTVMGQDFQWAHSQQLNEFKGTEVAKPVQDLLGYQVLAEADNIFIGAPYESNKNGGRAGAVYALVPPPTIHLVGPVCKTSAPITLHGYPLGGTWSGTGITDASAGIFNVTSLDTGQYLVSYTIPSCSIPSKMLIHVVDGTVIVLNSPSKIVICPKAFALIQLNPLAGASYQWYFKGENDLTYKILEGQSASNLQAELAGYYYCQVTLGTCSNVSPSSQVSIDVPGATVGPQDIVCQLTQNVTLKSNPTGGTWSGNQVQSNIFNPGGLVDGKYPVTYFFMTALGCQFQLQDSVVVGALPMVTLQQQPDDYCKTGQFTLGTSSQMTDWNYLWEYHQSVGQTSTPIDAVSQPSRSFSIPGYYQVIVSNKHCSTTTDALLTNIDSLTITDSPVDPLVKLCKSTSITLTATARDGTEYSWLESDSPTGIFVEVGSAAEFTATRDGYYKVQGTFGVCQTFSNVKKVIFLPSDSLFIPNVFTPNNDHANDILISKGNVNPTNVLIENRWGGEVYQASILNWDGGTSPSGTYFYNVIYLDCQNKPVIQKGWVELMR